MKRITERRRKPMAKGTSLVFAFLAVGFTLISAWNGIEFYRIVFGTSMALLITSVFETARLACVFRFVRSGRSRELLSIPIYIIVASVCAFASINSFASKTIRKDFDKEKEIQTQIHSIKSAYSEKTDEKLVTLERDIRYVESMISKYLDRDYWKRRLSQILANRDSLLSSRDSFLNANPEDPEPWIRANAALLGIQAENPSGEGEEIRSVTIALKELWNLNKITAQKIVGVIVTVTVELSILLLAFLSEGRKASKETLMSDFDERMLKKFIASNRDYFMKTGKLPPMRKLSPNLRPVRKALQDLDSESLKKIFR